HGAAGDGGAVQDDGVVFDAGVAADVAAEHLRVRPDEDGLGEVFGGAAAAVGMAAALGALGRRAAGEAVGPRALELDHVGEAVDRGIRLIPDDAAELGGRAGDDEPQVLAFVHAEGELAVGAPL